MRRLLTITASFVMMLGCNEIIDADRFFILDAGEGPRVDAGLDGGPQLDAGPRPDGAPPFDAGPLPDGALDCPPAELETFYRDRDEDGFGDPNAAIEACEAPPGYVSNGDDCDDTSDAINPDATEVCDDVDNDCDDAIDEGLIGPIGDVVEIEAEFQYSGGAGFEVVAHQTGYVIVWRNNTPTTIRATYLNTDGEIVRAQEFIASDGRSPRAAVYSGGGTEQVAMAWLTDTAMVGRLSSLDGSTLTSSQAIGPVDPGSSGTALLAAGERLISSWTHANTLNLRSYHPIFGSMGPTFTLEDTADVQYTRPFATVRSAPPRTLLLQRNGPENEEDLDLEDPPNYEIVSLTGTTTLTREGSSPWDTTERCAEAGRPICFPGFVIPSGLPELAPDSPFLVVESLFTGDGGTEAEFVTSALGVIREDDGTLRIQTRTPLPPQASFTLGAIRGRVASVAQFTGTGYLFRDIPLAPAASGGAGIPITALGSLDLFGGPRIAMRGGRGIIVGDANATTERDISAQLVGCLP